MKKLMNLWHSVVLCSALAFTGCEIAPDYMAPRPDPNAPPLENGITFPMALPVEDTVSVDSCNAEGALPKDLVAFSFVYSKPSAELSLLEQNVFKASVEALTDIDGSDDFNRLVDTHPEIIEMAQPQRDSLLEKLIEQKSDVLEPIVPALQKMMKTLQELHDNCASVTDAEVFMGMTNNNNDDDPRLIWGVSVFKEGEQSIAVVSVAGDERWDFSKGRMTDSWGINLIRVADVVTVSKLQTDKSSQHSSSNNRQSYQTITEILTPN